MINRFKDHIQSAFPSLSEAKILLATSAGVDSMVLTDLSQKLHLNIALAHCNFQLRHQESDKEESFLLAFAEQNQLEIFNQKFDTNQFAKKTKQSIQMAARQLRYEWFDSIAKENHFDFILTAHHADDNLETFFINLSRGSGLEGLSGIPEQNGQIIRPLLPFSRNEILNYAQENKLTWCEDSSNASLKYERNHIRHKLIPALKSITPDILNKLMLTQAHLLSAQKLLQTHIQSIERVVCHSTDSGDIHYDLEIMKTFGDPKHYLFPLLKKYGFTDWKALQNLVSSQSGKEILSPTHKVIKNRTVLIVTSLSNGLNFEPKCIEINSVTPIIQLSKVLKLDESKIAGKNKPYSIFVDKDKLVFPLTLRPWLSGDFFYPNGMMGRKKVSKFFKDEKLSSIEKSRVLVLCSNDQIVWIVGRRPDERFLANSNSTSILKISFEDAIN
ncbi:MAG: tRNA lysidine(34) synthetase TilS [Flavobacteriaceae bacterium]